MRAIRVQPLVDPARPRGVPWRSTDLRVEIAGLGLPVEVRDLSRGGFATVASKGFWRGMTHRFTFASPSGFVISLVAKAVRSYSLPQGSEPKFVTGWEFMAGSMDRTEKAIGQLTDASSDRLTDAL